HELRRAPRSAPLSKGESIVHRQPRLRRIDDAGRRIAARPAPSRRLQGHRQPRSLEAAEGRFAMSARLGSLVATLCLGALLALATGARAQGVEGRRYTPGPFDTLVITGSATFKLVQGGEDSVFIEGDEEAQGAARLDVE